MKLMRKFTLALAAGICVIFAIFGVYRVRSQTTFFQETMRQEHRALGRALGGAIAEVWAVDGQARALELVNTISVNNDDVNLRWVWFTSDASDYYRPAAPMSLFASLSGGDDQLTWVSTRDDEGSGRLYTYIPLLVRSEHRGGLELWASLDPLRSQVRSAIVAISGATLSLLVLSAALALAVGYWLVGRPVQGLVAQARRIGSGDFSHQLVPRTSGDELSELTDAFNAMCTQLSDAVESRIAAVNRLRHADRLATVGQLASGVAHELGTPLNTVALRAGYVEQDEQAPADVRENGRIIREQCQRMTVIIRQLLDFSRPRHSDRRAVELGGLLSSTLTMLEPMAKKHGAALVAALPPDGHSLCAAIDMTQMQQVLSNLVVNAMQAMDRGGEINVGCEAVAVEPPYDYEGGSRDFVRIYVRDNGHGIAPHVRERLFEPFFTTKDVGKGTGLGLAVAYGIVRDHTGWIDVQSEPGEGSVFSVYLPSALPSAADVACA